MNTRRNKGFEHINVILKDVMKKNKYGAKKTGGKDSKGEFERGLQLKQFVKEGKISNLESQVKFPIVINGQKVCTYIADYVYIENGIRIVEDVKSEFTAKIASYRLKNKLMKAVLGIDIREIIV